ncbi:hypothetical protein [Amycolatopsis regifaucium]|uniref:Asp23/Gls24 family envelope stress response protein n=3 Tax=Amycolatopsis regifaucium TaxID=546365 RepID=A0A154M8H8_9PSEU|nr:hypothetical protein [Amycolatopsis regifaucium]KZB80637.1 hypothetical protein AVL48_11725 [Amycolatopsis regifaucium]SFH01434.1 hypothetical protein SAMN04489731_10264 [Amycolatopsis regifaucium]
MTQDPRDDPRWEQVRAVASRPVPTPPGLVERVLRSVGGVRGGRTTPPLDLPSAGGKTQVSERALVLMTRKLAAEIGRDLGGVHVSAVALEDDVLQVLVTVRFGVEAAAADLLRRRVTEALTGQLGSAPPTVNIHVVDVHPD